MPGINTRPASVRVWWKYRLEGIHTKRQGAIFDKPNIDSNGILAGIQNTGLFEVPFIPSAETIDLYYQPINANGQGPAVDIISTPIDFTSKSVVTPRGSFVNLIGPVSDLVALRPGDILRIDDEIVTVHSVSPPLAAELYEGLLAFWPLDEADGIRQNAPSNLYPMNAFSESNLVGSAAGPQAGTLAALFTGSEALRTPYRRRLSTGFGAGFTISAWIYPTVQTIATQSIISRCGGNAGGRCEFRVQRRSGDTIRFQVFDQSGNIRSVSLSGVQTNAWLFICAWFDPNTEGIYISINDTNTQSTSRTTESPDTSIELLIGAQISDASSSTITTSQGFLGRIANVGYWNRVLSDSERTLLFTDYVIDNEPRVHMAFGDRGAHGTTPAAHAIDAPVTKLRTTVPSNSIVMTELSDDDVPSIAASLRVASSNDAAEIGFELIVDPPITGTKTIKRIQIQASTTLWPANIEHTTGVKQILSGPHTGIIKQGDNILSFTDTLAATVASPYSLYVYAEMDVNTGVVKDAAAYTINQIRSDEIEITGAFDVAIGKLGDPQEINFLIFRGWFDAPVDYVINDVPIVTPPPGDVVAHVPFQRFYKTTKSVYIRARYYNRRGVGPWIYWDNVARVAA